ncbi:MAG TPA: tetratricopeptide repeat protein [Flavitalea sp.]|nr:tetratricopeptide repeat protein [Flavitalea sp.]
MKKKKIYLISIGLFIAAVVIICFRHQAKEKNKETKVYYLLERNGVTARMEEWNTVRSEVNRLIKVIQDNPGNETSLIALASAYIREARVTGNYMYYDRGAMKCVSDVLKKNENNFDALSLKAMILLSEHHFPEALITAKKAVSINPYNAFVYGVLVDGYVEMGDYESAVENLEKMMSIRPDMRAYARVSYLREIHGDYPGAIEAMKLAVSAGAPGDESTAWTRVQLAQLYEKTGNTKMAEINHLLTLNERPGYAYALAGLARIAVVQEKYDDAIQLYGNAVSQIQDYSLKEELSDVYRLKGEAGKADAIARTIVDELNKALTKEIGEDSAGHYSDRELAYAYLQVKDNDKALDHALAEYNRRPKNIDVNETLAWVYYCRGEFAKALPYIKAAMKTHSKNPVLLVRCGLILGKAGEVSTAKPLLQQVLAGNAHLPYGLKSESLRTLQTL